LSNGALRVEGFSSSARFNDQEGRPSAKPVLSHGMAAQHGTLLMYSLHESIEDEHHKLCCLRHGFRSQCIAGLEDT